MKTLLINGSPKKITRASQFYLRLLKFQMLGTNILQIRLAGPRVYKEIFSQFHSIDALVIALPVYVDGVPSHVLDFMTEAEKYCKEQGCHFKLYVIANCGFIEGRQCRNLLSNMHSFCDTAGLTWGGGIGIGGGEMLNVMKYTTLYMEILKFLLSLPVFLLQGDLPGGLAHYPWISSGITLLVYFILNLGLFFSIWKMQRGIRHGKTIKDFYVRPPLPKFLFIISANGYFIFRAAYYGTGFWKIYHKT